MRAVSPLVIQEIRELLQCPSFEFDLRPEWGAHSQDHRSKIRTEISRVTGEDFSDLSTWPLPREISVSISHCSLAGGFASVSKPNLIGFDIEISERVKTPIIARVAHPGELELAPRNEALWSAKEAAFKALSQAGLASIISDLSVFDWKSGPQTSLKTGNARANLREFFSFQVSNLQTARPAGQGLVIPHDDVCLAFYLMNI